MMHRWSDPVMKDVSWKGAIDCELIYFTSTLGVKMDFGQSAESEVTPIAAACVAALESADLLVSAWWMVMRAFDAKYSLLQDSEMEELWDSWTENNTEAKEEIQANTLLFTHNAFCVKELSFICMVSCHGPRINQYIHNNWHTSDVTLIQTWAFLILWALF